MNDRTSIPGETSHEVHHESIHRDLLRHLVNYDRVSEVSEQFSVLRSNPERVRFLHELLREHKLLPVLQPDGKNDQKALEWRQQGNEMFKRKKNKEALDFYTRSLTYSASSENASLALANRSAVLYEYGFYEECLSDIQRAFDSGYPENLRWKLNVRQKNAEEFKLNKSKFYHESIPRIPDEIRSEQIENAINALGMEYNEELGRHIIAKRDIQVGEILAVERPFCHILINNFLCHCHECLKLCYNLIPCGNCTQVLYCSETCRQNAVYYHKHECNILKTLRHLQLGKLKMLPLKITLVIKDLYRSIDDNYMVDMNEKYYSNRYKEIHNLVGNTEKRTVSDIFERSTTAAMIYHLIKTHTAFFQSVDEEKMFEELLLHHLQTAPSNFHEISELAENQYQTYELKEIGAGAYSFLSLFNHSCSPNVVRHCYGSTIVLRAIQSIKKGEQCNDNYGYHHALMNKSERRNQLRKQYFFDCNCEVCLHDWPMLQELPTIKTDIEIDSDDLLGLRRGDLGCAKKVLRDILSRINDLERLKPNRNHCEIQEVLKQCFALFGNVRRTL
ncbi:hypothetical protein JTB14_029457 [Gonioctena quinquepunctata]|nr:hypothetical protein JTB14_029457 [Gonioctena quinquepunctata]